MFEVETFDSGFCKREFVVTTDEKYPQEIKLAFVKDKCEKLDDYKVGDKVTVGFNLRGNPYKEKWYVDLQAWRISAAKAEQSEAPADDDALPY